MSRFKNLISVTKSGFLHSRCTFIQENSNKILPFISLNHPSQWTSIRFLDIFQMANKAALEKEKARLADEMNRGYFADIHEMKEHGGKIGKANKVIVPAMKAIKFPTFEAETSNGLSFKLPIMPNGSSAVATKDVPKATLMCLSFRSSSQAMVDSWSKPFCDAFKDSANIHLYKVSLIDSWLLTKKPIKTLLLRTMRKSNLEEKKDGLQTQFLYSFGDHYYFRKELKILNLLTGYIFLLDKFGRIRWQGFGVATEEEVQSLFSCTSVLLQEELQ